MRGAAGDASLKHRWELSEKREGNGQRVVRFGGQSTFAYLIGTIPYRLLSPSFNSASARGGLALHGMGLKLEWANEDVHVKNEETAADEQGSTWGSAGKLNDGRQLPPPTEGAVDNPHPTGGWPPRLG